MKKITTLLGAALLMAAGSFAMSAQASNSCELMTYISQENLYNSQGKKLQSTGQIVRQSVAQYVEDGQIMGCGLEKVATRTKLQKAIDNTRQDRDVVNAIKEGDVPIAIDWQGNKAYLSISDTAFN